MSESICNALSQLNFRFKLDQLPSELLLMIIKNLDDLQDRHNVAQLSPRLAMIVKDSNRFLDIGTLSSQKGSSLDSEMLALLLKDLPNIEQLSLSNKYGENVIRRFGPDAHFSITDNCRLLTRLDFTRISFAPNELTLVMTKCSNVETLVINQIILEDMNEINRLLPRVGDKLLHLSMCGVKRNLFSPTYTNHRGMSVITLALKSLDIRRSTIISDISATNRELEFFDAANLLYSCSDLKQLSFTTPDQERLNQLLAVIGRYRNELDTLILDQYSGMLPDTIKPTFIIDNTYNACQEEEELTNSSKVTPKEIIKLEDSLLVCNKWLEKSLEDSQQYVNNILWRRDSCGDRHYLIARLDRSSMKKSFTRRVHHHNEIKIIEKNEQNQKIWSAKGKPLLRLINSEDFLYIELKMNTYDELYQARRKSSIFKIVNISLRDFYRRTIEVIKQNIRRIADDGLLREIALNNGLDKVIISNIDSKNKLKSTTEINTMLDDHDLSFMQKKAITHAASNRITLMMGGPQEKSSAIASLVVHLFDVEFERSNFNSRILICNSSITALNGIADKITQMSDWTVRIFSTDTFRSQPQSEFEYEEYEDDEDGEDIWDLSQYCRNVKHVRVNLDSLKLDSRGKIAEWRLLEEAQVICCTCEDVLKLSSHTECPFDTIIIDDGDRINIAEGELLFQFLPRRIVLSASSSNSSKQPAVAPEKPSLFTKFKNLGFKPVMLNLLQELGNNNNNCNNNR